MFINVNMVEVMDMLLDAQLAAQLAHHLHIIQGTDKSHTDDFLLLINWLSECRFLKETDCDIPDLILVDKDWRSFWFDYCNIIFYLLAHFVRIWSFEPEKNSLLFYQSPMRHFISVRKSLLSESFSNDLQIIHS